MVLDRLRVIFREVFDQPNLAITPETSAEDIPAWDSVAHLNLILAVSEAFNIELSTEDAAGLITVGDFIRVIEAQGVQT